MAVEARHNMNLFPSHQFILPNRDFVKLNQEAVTANTANYYAPNSITTNSNNYINIARETLSPGLIYPQHSMNNNTTTFNNKQAESGLTQAVINPPRKRPRDQYQSNDIQNHPSLLDNDIAFQILQHQSEIDRFVAQHTEKLRLEVEKQRKREARMVVSAIEEGIAKRLREKDEEIVRMGKINWALQERVRALCVENQIWKDLAQSNEATAMTLRTNLEQLLLAHVSPAGAGEGNDAVEEEGEGDAESCCGENDAVGGEGEEEGKGVRRCRGCGGEEEARVLVLPCRHLCLCTACGSTVRACPVCHSVMTASVRVNFS